MNLRTSTTPIPSPYLPPQHQSLKILDLFVMYMSILVFLLVLSAKHERAELAAMRRWAWRSFSAEAEGSDATQQQQEAQILLCPNVYVRT